jgi:hypothetical protein
MNHVVKIKISIPLVLLLCQTLVFANSPAGQYLQLDDWSYDLISYWQNNGTLSMPFILYQPYTMEEVRWPDASNQWVGLIRDRHQRYYGEPGKAKLLFGGREYVSFSNGDRVSPGSEVAAPLQEPLWFDPGARHSHLLTASARADVEHVSFVHRTVINSEYRDDERYFGDLSQKWFARINDAYARAQVKGFRAFFGRTDRNWGIPGSPSLILSNNPYSYDHLLLSYDAGRRLRISMMVSRLEDLQGVDFESEAPDSLVAARKFFTAHRFDFSVSPRLQFALTEVAIFGGPYRSFEFGYLNPLNFFYLVQRNNQQQVSGLWAVDLFWAPTLRTQLFLQFLVDDFIVNNVPGQDDRARYPDRLGIKIRYSEADNFLDGLQSYVQYTRIGNRTYQSFRTWENYHYHGKGLGYPSAGIEKFEAGANFFGFYPGIWNMGLEYQRRGQVSLTDVFTGQKEDFPAGVVERALKLHLGARYLVGRNFTFSGRIEYQRLVNYQHVTGLKASELRMVLGLTLFGGLGFDLR